MGGVLGEIKKKLIKKTYEMKKLFFFFIFLTKLFFTACEKDAGTKGTQDHQKCFDF